MLKIPQSIYQQLIDHLQRCYPEEGCGLLAGKEESVHSIYPIENQAHSPVRYKMAPAAQIEAMLDLEDNGWELLAIYHSHPHSAAYPSATDIAQAAYPQAGHLIVSFETKPPQPRLFQIKESLIINKELSIV